MIIFDTNQIESPLQHEGPALSAVLLLTKAVGSRVAIPDIVLWELLAHQHHRLETASENLRKASNEFADVLGRSVVAQHSINVQAEVQRFGDRIRRDFEILPTKPEDALTGLNREAHRIAPASTSFSKAGFGARDAAIWLTALRTASATTEKTIFVSSDETAFGKGNLRRDLQDEVVKRVETVGGCLQFCSTIVDLIDNLATGTLPAPDELDLRRSKVIRNAALDALEGPELFFSILNAVTNGATVGPVMSADLDAEAVQAKAQGAYEVNGKRWCVASVTWSCSKAFSAVTIERSPFLQSRRWESSFKVRTNLVLELSETGDVSGAEVAFISQPKDVSTVVTH